MLGALEGLRRAWGRSSPPGAFPGSAPAVPGSVSAVRALVPGGPSHSPKAISCSFQLIEGSSVRERRSPPQWYTVPSLLGHLGRSILCFPKPNQSRRAPALGPLCSLM